MDSRKGDKIYGPIIVSAANAARSFDAPVRYPLLFNSPDVFVKPMAMPRASSFITLIEHFLGLLILLPILLIKRGTKQVFGVFKEFDRRDWISLIFISAGGSALGLFFFLISLGLGNPTVAILIQKSQPLITLIFAIFILKEKPSLRFYVVLLLAITGIGLIAWPDISKSVQTLEFTGLIAILCSLLAAVFWGGSTVFGRILTKKVDYWNLTLFRYIGGFFFLLVFNIFTFTYNSTYFGLLTQKINVFGHYVDGSFVPLDWQWIGILCILYAAILTGGVLPLALYYFGLTRSKASVAGLAELAFPILSIFINYYFLGFGLEPIQIVGAIILLASVSTLSYINAKEFERDQQILLEKDRMKEKN
ncbi:MAG: DMT family transporter [Candidatus Heimdallarchaeum aukensis]|uniref:DMT family transporter n=1 Tax=Candidatus Heimdallarchaeum aukensis TaxID=2876573 RepID=A0A9Y1BLN8_9ARCH|nr:MAG: DMT family transporter [Candidatus Heimdallarchaeum aukensis]